MWASTAGQAKHICGLVTASWLLVSDLWLKLISESNWHTTTLCGCQNLVPSAVARIVA